jgi:hypothetical protein
MDPIKDTNAAAIIEVARLAERSQATNPRDIGGASTSSIRTRRSSRSSTSTIRATPQTRDRLLTKRRRSSTTSTGTSCRQTHIFGKGDRKRRRFTAVLDYHKDEAKLIFLARKMLLPSWGEHEATLKLETTPEWNRWIASTASSKRRRNSPSSSKTILTTSCARMARACSRSRRAYRAANT